MFVRLIAILLIVYILPVHADTSSSRDNSHASPEEYESLSNYDSRECVIKKCGTESFRAVIIRGIYEADKSAYKMALEEIYTNPELIDSNFKEALIIAMRDDTLNMLEVYEGDLAISIPCGLSDAFTYKYSLLSVKARQQKLNKIILDNNTNENITKTAKTCSMFLDYNLLKAKIKNLVIDSPD